MKPLIIIFGLFLIITSCEHSYDYSYTVINKTDKQIKVYVKTFRIDSTFIISNDSTKTLFVADHGIEGSKGPYFRDVNEDLDIFRVTINDTLSSTRNYLKNESWTFNKGVYSTNVTDAEFHK
jgi:hypothetical protein